MLYRKETKDLTDSEMASARAELDSLQPAIITEDRIKSSIVAYPTMLNGKAISAITNVASQNCHICFSKPSQMNKIVPLKDKPQYDVRSLQYGLTTMHAWIKCMELVLHISYYLEWKKPTIAGATTVQREVIENRKTSIKQQLRDSLGIYIDRIVQGKGTSNTANVGRTFLKNYKIVSEITEVDEKLIKRFYIIMVTLSCGRTINFENFEKYTHNTAKLYVSLYGWYRLPVSIHKILMHGADVARYLMLPIGIMSEEAQESANKIYRSVREHHTRKNLKMNTIRDLINRMIELSDPVISSIRAQRIKVKREELPLEIFRLKLIEDVLLDDSKSFMET